MKLRLLRRRLSISAPKVTVRSHLPWPVRVVAMALILGLAAALAVWAYDAGRRLTGTHAGDLKAENQRLKQSLNSVTAERDALSVTANTAEAQLNIARTAKMQLVQQVKLLEAEAARLREDLAFFESLLPVDNKEVGIHIRRIKVVPDEGSPDAMNFHILIMQGGGKAFQTQADFNGQLQLLVTFMQNGKSVTMALPRTGNSEESKSYQLYFKQYQRVEGRFMIPAGTKVKSVLVRVMQSGQVRAAQTVNL